MYKSLKMTFLLPILLGVGEIGAEISIGEGGALAGGAVATELSDTLSSTMPEVAEVIGSQAGRNAAKSVARSGAKWATRAAGAAAAAAVEKKLAEHDAKKKRSAKSVQKSNIKLKNKPKKLPMLKIDKIDDSVHEKILKHLQEHAKIDKVQPVVSREFLSGPVETPLNPIMYWPSQFVEYKPVRNQSPNPAFGTVVWD